MSLVHISQLVLPGQWGRGQHLPSLSHGTPISQPPLVAEALSSVSPFPAPLEGFGVCPSHVLCLFLVFVSWSCRGSEVQARGSIQLLSLSCHCCPLLILPLLSLLCLPSPALCLTLLHKGCLCWSAAKLPLNTDFSSWIF